MAYEFGVTEGFLLIGAGVLGLFVLVSIIISGAIIWYVARREKRRQELKELNTKLRELIDKEGLEKEKVKLDKEKGAKDWKNLYSGDSLPGIWSECWNKFTKCMRRQFDGVFQDLQREENIKQSLLQRRLEILEEREKKHHLDDPLDVDIRLEEEEEDDELKHEELIEEELEDLEQYGNITGKRLFNVFYIFLLQLRLRKSYFLLYFLFISKNPWNLTLIPIAILTVLIESVFCTIYFVLRYRDDLHSPFRITIRWELDKESRYLKYIIWLVLTCILVGSCLLFIYLTVNEPTIFHTTVFKTLFGNCANCSVTEGSDVSYSVVIPIGKSAREWLDWFFFLITVQYLDLIKGCLTAFLLYRGLTNKKLNYDGPSCERYVRLLKEKPLPEININLGTILQMKAKKILNELLMILFFVESKADVEKLRKLSSYKHYEWGLIKGMSTKRIRALRDYFFDFGKEEEHTSCVYENQKYFPFNKLFGICCKKRKLASKGEILAAIEKGKKLQTERIRKIKCRKASKLKRLKRKEDLFFVHKKIEENLNEIEKNLGIIRNRKNFIEQRKLLLKFREEQGIRGVVEDGNLEEELEKLDKDDVEGIWELNVKFLNDNQLTKVDKALNKTKKTLIGKERIMIDKQKLYNDEERKLKRDEEQEEKEELEKEIKEQMQKEIKEKKKRELAQKGKGTEDMTDEELIEFEKNRLEKVRKRKVWKGVFYILLLQLKLRISYLMIILMLITSEFLQLGICLIILGVDFVFISCTMLYRYRNDLHSPFRVVIRWECDRESRLFKYYSAFIVTLIYIVGVSCVFNLRTVLIRRDFSDYYSLFNPKVIPQTPLETMKNCTCTQDWEDSFSVYSKTEKYAIQGYFWFFLLFPFIKYLITGFIVFVKTVAKTIDYDGPGALRYVNQLYQKEEESFTIDQDFPKINFTPGRMNQKTKKILQETLKLLFFVQTKEDVEAFSRVPSLRHLDWALIKKLDSRTISDLRKFFFKVDEENEVAVDKGLIEDQFETWMYRNEKCCCCLMLINCCLKCKPFGSEIEDFKEKRIRILETRVKEFEFEREGLSEQLLLLKRQIKKLDET